MVATHRSATPVADRPGTKATTRYVRMSASKARAVLKLIRGKDVEAAAEILEFTERLAAEPIGKCLRSAVANAEHNEDIPVEELFISACYADEGPTLKRYRPRARGRAGRIHKPTCHITIVVSRLTDEELDEARAREERKAEGRQARAGRRSGGGSADRARRVARSRAAQAEADGEEDTDTDLDEAAAEEAAEGAADGTTVNDAAAEDTADAAAEDTADDATTDETETDADATGKGATEKAAPDLGDGDDAGASN